MPHVLDENELMLAMHNMLELVEKDRGCNAAAAYEELAAEERGAILEEADA